MNIRILTIFAASLAFSGAAFAEEGDGAALVKKNSCMMCHSSGPGPVFTKVAEKYKADKDAQAMLEKKVRSGGSGAWGKVPMPPTPKKISDEDIKNIVEWILAKK